MILQLHWKHIPPWETNKVSLGPFHSYLNAYCGDEVVTGYVFIILSGKMGINGPIASSYHYEKYNVLKEAVLISSSEWNLPYGVGGGAGAQDQAGTSDCRGPRTSFWTLHQPSRPHQAEGDQQNKHAKYQLRPLWGGQSVVTSRFTRHIWTSLMQSEPYWINFHISITNLQFNACFS